MAKTKKNGAAAGNKAIKTAKAIAPCETNYDAAHDVALAVGSKLF